MSIYLPSLLEFQFLIGRLDTDVHGLLSGGFIMFHFLIGRLDTIASRSLYRAIHPFQFLIGRLDTLGSQCRNLFWRRFNSS